VAVVRTSRGVNANRWQESNCLLTLFSTILYLNGPPD
jgi:hypothetical protein